MNLFSAGAKAPAPVAPLELVAEYEMPAGTITVIVDRIKGVMDIYAEQDPHPMDWDLACALIKKMGLAGQLGEPEYLRGVDVFRLQLKRAKPAPKRRAAYRTVGAAAAAMVAMMALAPAASPPDFRDVPAAMMAQHRPRRISALDHEDMASAEHLATIRELVAELSPAS